jgi:hypothetical protein
MPKLIVLSFFFLYAFTNSFAAKNYTISGTITDAGNGESLIGATIKMKGNSNIGATTNAYGYFSLTLPEGKYSLEISYLGYKTIVNQLLLIENNTLQYKM